jgi:hypothetical protein
MLPSGGFNYNRVGWYYEDDHEYEGLLELPCPFAAASEVEEIVFPTIAHLKENYLNPFDHRTVIKYRLPAGRDVRLRAYDILDREVSVLVNEKKDAGVPRVKAYASRQPVPGFLFFNP